MAHPAARGRSGGCAESTPSLNPTIPTIHTLNFPIMSSQFTAWQSVCDLELCLVWSGVISLLLCWAINLVYSSQRHRPDNKTFLRQNDSFVNQLMFFRGSLSCGCFVFCKCCSNVLVSFKVSLNVSSHCRDDLKWLTLCGFLHDLMRFDAVLLNVWFWIVTVVQRWQCIAGSLDYIFVPDRWCFMMDWYMQTPKKKRKNVQSD